VACPSMHHVGGGNVITAQISTVAPQDADPQYSCAVGGARLVERALATGARVRPVEGAASGVRSEAAGIGALLRW
jgi:hypothetical protein